MEERRLLRPHLRRPDGGVGLGKREWAIGNSYPYCLYAPKAAKPDLTFFIVDFVHDENFGEPRDGWRFIDPNIAYRKRRVHFSNCTRVFFQAVFNSVEKVEESRLVDFMSVTLIRGFEKF